MKILASSTGFQYDVMKIRKWLIFGPPYVYVCFNSITYLRLASCLNFGNMSTSENNRARCS